MEEWKNGVRKKVPFRSIHFKFHEFFNYQNLKSHYQRDKLTTFFQTFFQDMEKNFVVTSFSNDHYRKLVTIPLFSIEKEGKY